MGRAPLVNLALGLERIARGDLQDDGYPALLSLRALRQLAAFADTAIRCRPTA